jgi:hypothetical protein
VGVAGGLHYVTARGKFRVCYDSAASGDCTEPLAGIVIGKGRTLTQTRGIFVGLNVSAIAQATSVVKVKHRKKFWFDGKKRKLDKGESIVHSTVETLSTLCGSACGVVSTSVAVDD